MKASTRKFLRLIISILYLIWGVGSVFLALQALLALDIGGILAAASGVIMFVAGLLGLLKAKPAVCRICGLITFVLALVSAILSFSIGSVVTAVLAWLFIICG